MQHKNTTLIGIAFLAIGIILGWVIWGNHRPANMAGSMHKMSDGSMMIDHAMNMDMNSMMTGMMAGLVGKTGDEFDKAFLSEMVVHHEGAVEMAKAVITQSKRPELIKLANDIITAQNGEITMMKQWQAQWFK